MLSSRVAVWRHYVPSRVCRKSGTRVERKHRRKGRRGSKTSCFRAFRYRKTIKLKTNGRYTAIYNIGDKANTTEAQDLGVYSKTIKTKQLTAIRLRYQLIRRLSTNWRFFHRLKTFCGWLGRNNAFVTIFAIPHARGWYQIGLNALIDRLPNIPIKLCNFGQVTIRLRRRNRVFTDITLSGSLIDANQWNQGIYIALIRSIILFAVFIH